VRSLAPAANPVTALTTATVQVLLARTCARNARHVVRSPSRIQTNMQATLFASVRTNVSRAHGQVDPAPALASLVTIALRRAASKRPCILVILAKLARCLANGARLVMQPMGSPWESTCRQGCPRPVLDASYVAHLVVCLILHRRERGMREDVTLFAKRQFTASHISNLHPDAHAPLHHALDLEQLLSASIPLLETTLALARPRRAVAFVSRPAAQVACWSISSFPVAVPG
jgi:hypothetical protein